MIRRKMFKNLAEVYAIVSAHVSQTDDLSGIINTCKHLMPYLAATGAGVYIAGHKNVPLYFGL